VREKIIIIGTDLKSSNINHLVNKKNFKYFKADITDSKSFPPELKQTDILIHCAALVHNRSRDLSRENYFKINCDGTKNILSFLDKKRLIQIIFLSTVSVYGQLAQEKVPDENSRLVPNDFYGESKLAAENKILKFSKINEIPYTILRLTPVYGQEFLLNINKRVYLPRKKTFYKIGSGEQQISICSVNNVIDVIAESIKNKNYLNETYNVKDKNDYSLNKIISVLRKVHNQTGKPIIWIPLFLVETIFKFVAIIFPKKGKFYYHQLSKISRDFVYSGNKLLTSRIKLRWDLNNTLSEQK
jgi:nucleoside-diphosphate-sugar epimerase